MKISLNWLNDFVSTQGIDIKKFCDKMTMTGSKVEGYKLEGEDIKKVVVGKILEIEKHPNADKLVVCTVDVGGTLPLTIVTGAKNVQKGDKIPVCLDGGELPNGVKIKEGSLRGVKSQGMMCSLGELNLTKEDFSYANEDGIFILDKSAKVGDDIKKALDMTDTSIEFEITSNRPDCLSVRGLAKEAAATFDRPFKDGEGDIKACGLNKDNLKVDVRSKKCKRYMARVIEDVIIKPSPKWLRDRLKLCGIRPINNIVDITNYVMLEYGQPMHAFDKKLIGGDQIIVREAKEGETLKTLDQTKCKLTKETLLICDKENPLALAGVMGGDKSSIVDTTKTVVFESASFDGASVRKTSKRFGIRTESSKRFEKGIDPNCCKGAIDKACVLVELIGAGKVSNISVDIVNFEQNKKWVDLSESYVNGLLGTNISRDMMIKILQKLDFEVDGSRVCPPSYRIDIENKADIAEEIARIYGYDNIEVTPYRGVSFATLSKFDSFKRKVLNTLNGFGMNEIYTYSFISPKNFDKLKFSKDDEKIDAIKIKNPLGEDTSIMRTTLVPSMLEVLARNNNNKNSNMRLFEIARVYLKKDDGMLANERENLVVGIYGDCDFYTIKGVLTSLYKNLNICNFDLKECSLMPFHKYRCLEIVDREEVVGIMGEIDPRVLTNYDIEKRVYILELDLKSTFNMVNPNIKFEPIAKYPPITRDLSLICDQVLNVGVIEDKIKQEAGGLLSELNLFDVYQGKQVGDGKKSVSYNLKFLSKEKTLKDEQVDDSIQKILKSLKLINVFLRES